MQSAQAVPVAAGTRSAATEPIIPGFYPDPTICRVGDDYYLSTSSFEYFPGAPIFHSTDLKDWRQIGHILSRRSQFRTGDGRSSAGIYAGTLRHHDGMFWFITSNVSDFAAGQLIVTADDPAGPWSDPVFVPDAIGIDPDLAWGDDGTCYLTWNEMTFDERPQSIRQAPIDPTTGRLLTASYPVWQGTGMMAPEGPHLFQRDGYWYLLLAEGGTERGHSVTIARSRTPAGPFDPCPWNPLLTHRSTGHPVQNVGHADMVEQPDGTWAAVYLGVRPSGPTPGFHGLGRETFLAGVEWVEGWPVFDKDRYSLPSSTTSFSDDFDAPQLDMRWVVPGGEPDTVAKVTADGLDVHPSSQDRHPLSARVRDRYWVARATVGQHGYVRLRLDERHWTGLIAVDGTVRAEARVGDLEQAFASVDVAGHDVVLEVRCIPPSRPPVPLGHGGPDEIALSVVIDGRRSELARIDGRYLTTEVASGFTGRMLAIGGVAGSGVFRRFSYEPLPEVSA